jgi:hypothetical protein
MPSGLGLRRCFTVEVPLQGGEDYGYDQEAEQQAAAVCDGVDDWVFVELAAGGLEPEAA